RRVPHYPRVERRSGLYHSCARSGVQQLPAEDAVQSTARVQAAPAGKVPLRLRHPAHVGVGRSGLGYSGGGRRRPRAGLCGWPRRCAPGVLRRSNRLPSNAEAATRGCRNVRSRTAGGWLSEDRSKTARTRSLRSLMTTRIWGFLTIAPKTTIPDLLVNSRTKSY